MSWMKLRSCSGKLATKSHDCDQAGVVTTQTYGKETWWFGEVVPIRDFATLTTEHDRQLDDPTALVVRGAPKPGVDLSQPIRRRSNGEDATIEDVPSRVLHLDIDCVDEPHLDVVNRPDEAREHVLGLIGKAAPELKGAACCCSWSSSAGIYSVTKAKIHIWYCSALPYTCAELNRWGNAVNNCAGFKLVDCSLFQPVQPNYVARPHFRGMRDPFPGSLRVRHLEGHAPTLVIPPQSAHQPIANRAPHGVRAISGGIQSAVQSMGDGEGKSGFHLPWNRAVAIFYARNGPDADPRPLLARLAARIKHGGRGDTYFRAELLGMIKRCRVLAAKERARKLSETATQSGPTSY